MAEELLLTGRRVVPEKALKHGFVFRYPTLRAALAAILGARACRQQPPGGRGKFRPAACRDVTKGQFVNRPQDLTKA